MAEAAGAEAPTDLAQTWQDAVWEIVANPLNLALLVVAGWLLKQLITPPPPPQEPRRRRQIVTRDFTLEELRQFNGEKPSAEHDGERAIYMAVNGVVFDVTAGASFYGPGGPYSVFAGRDASRGLATLDHSTAGVRDEWDDLSTLSPMERQTMMEWFGQFQYKYPIRGRLVREHGAKQEESAPAAASASTPAAAAAAAAANPVPDKVFHLADLRAFNGATPATPIYIAVNGDVFDVTSGRTFYGPGGPYSLYAGRDASRGLGTMNVTDAAVSDDWDSLDDLTDTQRRTLDDWATKLRAKYPIMGRLERAEGEKLRSRDDAVKCKDA